MRAKIASLSLLILTAMIWGFAFVAQVKGTEYIGPFTMIGTRFLIAIIVLLPVVLILDKRRSDIVEKKKTTIASVIAGSILFCASALQQYGIQMTASAGVSGFITGLYTVLVPIACYVFFKQKTGMGVVIGAVLASIGLFLLCYRPGEGLHFGVGELLLFVGAFFWTAHVVVIDRMGKDISSLRFAWGQFAVCAVLGLVSMFLFEEPQMVSILDAKWAILYCGVMSSGVAYTLQVVAQKKAEPASAAIVLSTESVFSAIGGAIFKIDNISFIGYMGCALMFGGIVLSQLNIGKGDRMNL